MKSSGFSADIYGHAVDAVLGSISSADSRGELEAIMQYIGMAKISSAVRNPLPEVQSVYSVLQEMQRYFQNTREGKEYHFPSPFAPRKADAFVVLAPFEKSFNDRLGNGVWPSLCVLISEFAGW